MRAIPAIFDADALTPRSFSSELGQDRTVGEGGVRVINADVVRLADVTHEEMSEVEKREQAEVSRRARRFRGDRAPIDLAGRTVILVDDGSPRAAPLGPPARWLVRAGPRE
ncbi:hypothetical protein ACIHFD_60840 [Nonomuraea sp. NPDC051941]|uniref:hypothetical protein n=1 Tax=Nonomuraea sp. NPDC051941 TaxID=3364373 RepID=UPI0037C91C4A